MKPTRLFLVVLLVATLGLGFFAGFWMPDDDDFFALQKNFEIFGSVYEELVSGYVDPLDAEQMMRKGLEAMLHDLDPYTVFYDEADNTDISIIARGRYAGVGLDVGVRNGQMTVSEPVEGASGYKQGIRTGDIITRVAGTATTDLSLSDVQNLMVGEPGTTIEVFIEREGEPEPLRFVLTREEVKVKNVSMAGFVADDPATGIGYVKLDRFGRDAGAEVRRALQGLQKEGEVNGVVLDLRDNPGGLLDDAVEIVQLFVPQGSLIVSTRGRTAQTERVYHSKVPPLLPDVPVVVLVNEFSASASEIVAGAMQDLDRGLIVGTTSYGKGLVQVVRPLPYNTSLKITIAKYYIPSGRSIQAVDYSLHDGTSIPVPDSLRSVYKTAAGREVKDGRGIEPDVYVGLGEASELERALRRRAAFFFFANHYAATHPSVNPDLAVTDDLLQEFKTWLDAEDFTYKTAAERSVERLAVTLESLSYEGASDEVDALQRAVLAEKAADFDRHEVRLKERLRTEILARYLGQTEQVKASLEQDPQFQRALTLLNDPNAYRDAF